MKIDMEKVRQILDEYLPLSPYEAYYRKDHLRYKHIGFVPQTRDMLRRGFVQSKRVLDIGCGDGRTLIEHAHLFAEGCGLDESGDTMICRAEQERDRRGITNLSFHAGPAVKLPFESGRFDMVFSERGPLGHNDPCLVEALRVLRTGGLILIETGGTFETLAIEKSRCESHGVDLETLCARKETLVFADFYDFLNYHCSVRRYLGQALPDASGADHFSDLLDKTRQPDGKVGIVYSTIILAGTKIVVEPSPQS